MVIVLVFSAIFHEYAHGLVAYMNGDPTAKNMGRLTFNPIPHIDPFYTILLPMMMVFLQVGFVIGGAKPVPVNPFNLQGKYAGMKVALAGPVSNLILATFFGLIVRFVPAVQANSTLFLGFSIIVFINLLLAFFNLLPIPPLDGSHVLFTFFPSIARPVQTFFARHGIIVFFAVIFLFRGQIFAVIGYFINIFFYLITGTLPMF